eukprot:5456165-Amphidinium_carterae.1
MGAIPFCCRISVPGGHGWALRACASLAWLVADAGKIHFSFPFSLDVSYSTVACKSWARVWQCLWVIVLSDGQTSLLVVAMGSGLAIFNGLWIWLRMFITIFSPGIFEK